MQISKAAITASILASLSGATFGQQKALTIPVDVRVVNTPAQAVPVTVTNQLSDRRPEMYRQVLPDGGALATVVPKPAAGRRFVATHVSFTMNNNSGQTITAAGCNVLLSTTTVDGTSAVLIAAFKLENAGYWGANQSVTFVLSDNQSLGAACAANVSNNSMTATIGGYSESAQ